MPRYYFHVRRGQVTIPDPKGVALASHQAAAEYGRRLALREAPNAPLCNSVTIIVNDGSGTIFEFPSGDPWVEGEDKAAS